jgi:hypothetical protein
MTSEAFESLTRRAAAAISRRGSLAVLGGTALAAASRPEVSDAKKGGQSRGKKQKKKCKNDAAACKNTLIVGCQGDQECITTLTPCRDTCRENGFLTCLLAAQAA